MRKQMESRDESRRNVCWKGTLLWDACMYGENIDACGSTCIYIRMKIIDLQPKGEPWKSRCSLVKKNRWGARRSHMVLKNA